MSRLRLVTSQLVAAALALSSPAVAGDATLAESLFREGRALMEAGDYAAACPKLAESHAQDPATGTLLALAFCQEELGLTASAWTSFGEAAARAKREGSAEREQAARQGQAALEPKLSRLTVEVGDAAAAVEGLVVERDGVAMGRPAWGSALAIDPGEHSVRATAPGRIPWQMPVTVGAAADQQTVEVPLLADAAGSVAPGDPSDERDDRAVASADVGKMPLTTIGLITGGVGIVGLGVGGFFGLRAMSLGDESNAGCDDSNACTNDAYDKRKDAIGAATVSTVAFIAGGVLTAAGVTLLIIDSGGDAGERLEASPVVGPDTAAVTLRGRF